MCDVCNEHNAYGLEEEDIGVKCHTCPHIIDPYEEKVNVWNIFNEEHPSGIQIFLCTKCHHERKYGGIHQNSDA